MTIPLITEVMWILGFVMLLWMAWKLDPKEALMAWKLDPKEAFLPSDFH
jgi:threonine/homoserine/homoserine lactone efflux protein